MEDAEKSKSSNDFLTGKLAAFSRAAALEASREATSASMRLAKKSSGDQRWVFVEDHVNLYRLDH
jgi:hypothetical protein